MRFDEPPAELRVQPAELVDGDINANVGVRPEHDALFVHDIQSAIEDLFFHLEFRDSISQQTANTVRAF